ncbi:MAG: hypothetical protein FWD68_00525 [Alphaproteobacteria bacterium]|nr:hypothetical protein [Alphaproteobacteria bacterium]
MGLERLVGVVGGVGSSRLWQSAEIRRLVARVAILTKFVVTSVAHREQMSNSSIRQAACDFWYSNRGLGGVGAEPGPPEIARREPGLSTRNIERVGLNRTVTRAFRSPSFL